MNSKTLASGRSSPSNLTVSGVFGLASAMLSHRLPCPVVQRDDGAHHAHPIEVLEIEQVLKAPVQVIGQVRDLLPQCVRWIALHPRSPTAPCVAVLRPSYGTPVGIAAVPRTAE